MTLHRYADAVRAYDRALAIAPDLAAVAIAKGFAYVQWKGSLDTLRSALAVLPSNLDLGSGVTPAAERATLLLWERKADSLLILLRDPPGGLAKRDELSHPDLFAAWAHELRGDRQAARASFASALSALTTESDAGLYGYYIHARRGAALAGLGRRTEALQEVRWLRESRTCREDHQTAGPDAAEARAIILARLGESDAALDEIERQLAGPSKLTVHMLRLDPRWDPIRQHPRFKALLVKYADPEKWAVR
jgi:tetratricopeptide (TPR) repeat protein